MSIDGPVALWAAEPAYVRDQVVEPGDEPELRDVALTAYDDDGAVRTSVRVAELPVEWPLVDVLSDGSFLVVGARCQWRSSGPDQNALAIDQGGAIVRKGCLGDGIEHVQVAADGSIWAGYFDEGVFGNYGWLSPGPAPLGAAGIVRWSPDFAKEWELDPGVGVADCESLNVATDEVLACPYTGGHPVVRIAGGRHRALPTEDVAGVTGIVASGNRIGLIGATATRPSWSLATSTTAGSSSRPAPGSRARRERPAAVAGPLPGSRCPLLRRRGVVQPQPGRARLASSPASGSPALRRATSLVL